MKFNYRARTKEGKVETGTIEATSKEAAALLLQKYNVFVTSLDEKGVSESFLKQVRFERKVSKKELAIFFRQLSVMLESGVPVVQSLSGVAAQHKKQQFRDAIKKIASLVEEGVPLSGAFAQHPSIFTGFYVSLVKSGEASGKIAGALSYISTHLETEDDIISQVRQAMIYPILVVSALFIVVGIIIVQVMPRIGELIAETGTKPPMFTQVMLGFYKFLEYYWWAILIILFFFGVSLAYYFRTKEGKKTFNRLILKIPLASSILKKVFLTRFCSNVSTLLVAGISINNALKITEETVNNVVYQELISNIGKKVSEGEKMSSSMMEYPEYFPAFVVQMIKVGEETGKLDTTLMEVVNFYQKEIKRSIDVFSKLLEPIMIVVLGVVVGILALSVLAPLYGALGSI